jgi:hypothetical protein
LGESSRNRVGVVRLVTAGPLGRKNFNKSSRKTGDIKREYTEIWFYFPIVKGENREGAPRALRRLALVVAAECQVCVADATRKV